MTSFRRVDIVIWRYSYFINDAPAIVFTCFAIQIFVTNEISLSFYRSHYQDHWSGTARLRRFTRWDHTDFYALHLIRGCGAGRCRSSSHFWLFCWTACLVSCESPFDGSRSIMNGRVTIPRGSFRTTSKRTTSRWVWRWLAIESSSLCRDGDKESLPVSITLESMVINVFIFNGKWIQIIEIIFTQFIYGAIFILR